MSPEQVNAGRIGVATDVWALGLLAFFMLTGRSYWVTANDPHGNIQRLLVEILVDPMEPASARAARLGAPGTIPAGFDPWLAACLARDPAARFADGGAAAAAYAALWSGTPQGDFSGAAMHTGTRGTMAMSTSSAPPARMSGNAGTPAPWMGSWTAGSGSHGGPTAGASSRMPVSAPPVAPSNRGARVAVGVLAGIALLATGTFVGVRMSSSDDAPDRAGPASSSAAAATSAPSATAPSSVPATIPLVAPAVVADDPKPPRAIPPTVAAPPLPIANVPTPIARPSPAPVRAPVVASRAVVPANSPPIAAPQNRGVPVGPEGFQPAPGASPAPVASHGVPATETADVQRALAGYTEQAGTPRSAAAPGTRPNACGSSRTSRRSAARTP